MAADARRLVLLRHGRTAWNAEHRAQGHADVELDDVGHTQAATVAPYVARLEPEALWSSDLARARQTAAYVEKETGLVARLDPRLREYDVGERTGLTVAEFAAAHPEEHAAWLGGSYDAVRGAEGTADVLARIVPACRELVATVAPGATAVAVTHGAALRVATAALLGWPVEHGRSLGVLDNCAMAVLDVPAGGAARLRSWNVGPDQP
ncbi:histidine phosphatase family protein [Nocardioides coralli]|uniref:histidine phosphatase family protein n=1 Tax=Nocardioides coralli TaxID=2872154 RepID=UPI001CA42EE4|nr:histidine phosphatase family protein [Nocardioides coralli]QZY30242.1 histidine phosphatase family protein [Nocardioides coralli]